MTEHLHKLNIPDKSILPEKFTFPFNYTPHPLCIKASEQVQLYLKEKVNSDSSWKEELDKGKMFGVLIVEDSSGNIGFVSAYSGNICGYNKWEYFVPPVYDLLSTDGYFVSEEAEITAINHNISNTLEGEEYKEICKSIEAYRSEAEIKLSNLKQQMKESKEKRDEMRKSSLTDEEEKQLIRESQFQKAEYKRVEKDWKQKISALTEKKEILDSQISKWKEERKRRSAVLQKKLFSSFRMLNAKGKVKDLCEIFASTPQLVPPAGAGECAAPKMLQYAFANGLTPIAMAEFWWGNSPKNEIRRHGYFYPSCKHKCEPILGHMLQGLDVEDNPVERNISEDFKPEILFEDEWIVAVNKPEGVLSVPGKSGNESVQTWAQKQYPDATGPMIVHRLDMATSGILLIAKTKEVHQHLQAQFKNRNIKKRYIALLDGLIDGDKGEINLPICPNPNDRPRQTVNFEYGKPALTSFEVINTDAERKITRIAFYPHTGRTHQLRVHSAHEKGLNTPILGDELYGKKAERLYLHAESIEFVHPATNKLISITCKPDF